MDKRHQRMLEDVLKMPGNETCADCHLPSPRWASVNLGIFLCVTCASVHRKLGTHYSRVKSVTLDTWTREQIVTMRSLGNTASNEIYNPDERLHPPPTAVGHDERDSELEKYIRRKYEYGSFKRGATAKQASAVPTSLNRGRERDGRAPLADAAEQNGRMGGNARNPELNDVLVRSQTTGLAPLKKERELPALPGPSPSATTAPPRQRPVSRSPSVQAGPSAGAGTQLIDLSGGQSSPLPLQLQGHQAVQGGGQGGLGTGAWQTSTSWQSQQPLQQPSHLQPQQTSFEFQHNNPFASYPSPYTSQNPYPAGTPSNGMFSASPQAAPSMYTHQSFQQPQPSYAPQNYPIQPFGNNAQAPGFLGQQPIWTQTPPVTMGMGGGHMTGQQGYFGAPQPGQYEAGGIPGIAQAGYGYGQSR